MSDVGVDVVSFFLFVSISAPLLSVYFFFFNDTATTEIYTLSLHDALPIYRDVVDPRDSVVGDFVADHPKPESVGAFGRMDKDRKSTRLNSSHSQISYAVFCLKKKKHTIRCFVIRHNWSNAYAAIRKELFTD